MMPQQYAKHLSGFKSIKTNKQNHAKNRQLGTLGV
jgi:hypothetical protein